MRGSTSQLLKSFNAEDVRPTYHTINVFGSVVKLMTSEGTYQLKHRGMLLYIEFV